MFGGEENLWGEIVTDQAESVIDYELGYNIQFKQVNANLNLYFMDFDNELILNGEFGTNGLPIRINTAKSYRTGIELHLKCNPVRGLFLRNTTSYSINKVETKEETLNHVMSPSWIVNQSINYTIKGFDMGVDMKYRSKMFLDLHNKYILDDALKFNAYITYTTPNNITLGFYVNNIFNNQSYSNGMFGANGPLYFIDAPRHFYANIQWSF
jgi:iron complex outermembrane receptor protein